MEWIVLKEEKGKIVLVSKKPEKGEVPGILPKGSFLTIDQPETGSKFILRVDDSFQYEPFSPSPMVVDMNLDSLYADRKCQNIVHAFRLRNISTRIDGQIDFIHPQSLARRSNQSEIDDALGANIKGPIVFPATVQGGQCQLLVDDQLNYVIAKLPEDIFFYQMQVCGKTGSGKTVATKYLAQYFVEEMNGAVLAINVKDIDFLQMDRPSNAINNQIIKEWGVLKTNAHPVNNFTIYYPANTNINSYRNINHDNCIAITLDVNSIEPDSLIGLLQNISDIAAQSLPDVFRFWKEEEAGEGDTFLNFVNFFSSHSENPILPTLNVRGDRSEIPIHRSTFNNILRSLNSATEFFDNRTAVSINWQDILQRGQFSVINVTGEKGTQFGSIILRHLLRQIVRAKSQSESEVPILVIIDEVHQFYNTDASREALDELDTICRTGRSQKIGVIFSSQNQEDLPKGLTSVINTKIFFKSDGISKNLFNISTEEIQTLDKGFAVANIHDLPQLKVLKFPLSYAGVINS